MLPSLPDTDILLHKPDVDGFDPWASDCASDNLPADAGVYCFYDGKTGEILYIGSACRKGHQHIWRGGLAGRLRHYWAYSKRHSSSEEKIDAERQKRQVLLRCWTARSAGDAIKYEYDAIEKHKPIFNSLLREPVRSIDENRASGRRRWHKKLSTLQGRLPPDDTPKTCKCCGKTKPLSEFYRNADKDGRRKICKNCDNEGLRKRRGVKRAALLSMGLPPEDTQKPCYRCGESKPLSDFSRGVNKDGRRGTCRACEKNGRKNVVPIANPLPRGP